MSAQDPTDTRRFWLDRARFSARIIADEDELFGIDSNHERGFAAAIASRFRDAEEAGAIRGPDGVEVVVYALDRQGLIVAVRERELPKTLTIALRQVASFSFDADEVACFGDERFEECCHALAELLERANALLPAFAAMRAAEKDAAAA